MLGTLLDQRYRLTTELGAGGFGQTYIAEDTRRPGHPQCVVKHLKPASLDTQFLEVARRLFQTEAEILERLGRHDQIPQLLAYFEDQKEFYLVQEFIQGWSLSDEMPTGQSLPETQVMGIFQEILNVLNFVHYHQVIHRDIKPDNLIRRQADHHLVLIDFGAVKGIRTQIAEAGQSIGYTVGIGTQGYMPGEQLSGRPRLNSDIYAVGMIGIKALTGVEPIQLPFDERTAEVQWRSLAPQVSSEFAHILERMVRSQFNTRYASVAEVLHDLQALAQPRDAIPVPPTEPVFSGPPLTSTTIPATDIVSPKGDDTPKPAKIPLWGMGAGLVGILSAGGALAYALGLMPDFTDANSRSSESTPAQSSIASPSSEPAADLSSTPDRIPLPPNCKVTVNDANPPLNVRSRPDAESGNIVATLENGTTLSVINRQADWLQIQSPPGWVSKNLTQQVCRLPAQRIQFAPGGTGTVLKQTLNQSEQQPFLLKAQAQQTLTARLTNGSVDVQVLDPQGKIITQVDRQTLSTQTELPLNGDYTINVQNPQSSSERFSLEVDVVSPAKVVPETKTSRIQFSPGATGTQLNDTIQSGQRHQYLLNAGAQQLMRINLGQGEIQLLVKSPDGLQLAQLNSQTPNWEGRLSSSGDYVLDVSAPQASPYSLDIDIEG